MQSRLMRRPLLSLVLLVTSSAFHSGGRVRLLHSRSRPPPLRALGDFTVELEKPLGVILEEVEAGGRGEEALVPAAPQEEWGPFSSTG